MRTAHAVVRNVMCIAIALLAGGPAASAQQLRLQDTVIAPGQAGNVKIVLEDAAGLGGLDMVIRYDPTVLRFEAVVKGTTGETMEFNGVSHRPGQLNVNMMNVHGLAGHDSPLEIRFTAVGQAGASSRLDIVAALAFSAETKLQMPMRFVGGKVSVAMQPPPRAAEPIALPTPPSADLPAREPDPAARSAPPGESSSKPDGPADQTGETWQIDGEMLLNIAIASVAGLLILVLLIGLFYSLRNRRAAGPGASPHRGRPADDDGPIPLEAGSADRAVHPPALQSQAPPTCPSCHQPITQGVRFCPHCGQKQA